MRNRATSTLFFISGMLIICARPLHAQTAPELDPAAVDGAPPATTAVYPEATPAG